MGSDVSGDRTPRGPLQTSARSPLAFPKSLQDSPKASTIVSTASNIGARASKIAPGDPKWRSKARSPKEAPQSHPGIPGVAAPVVGISSPECDQQVAGVCAASAYGKRDGEGI